VAGGMGGVAPTNSTVATEDPVNDWKPAVSNQQSKPYPEVMSTVVLICGRWWQWGYRNHIDGNFLESKRPGE